MQIFKTNKYLKSFKRALQGMLTVLKQQGFGGKTYGYYIPYPFAHKLDTPRNLYPLKSIKEILDTHITSYQNLCQKAKTFNNILEDFSTGGKLKPLAPRFNQDWFTGLDGAFTYTIVRTLKPKNIVEVGSGFSTRFLKQPVIDGGFDCRLISINPKKLHGADKLCDEYYNTTLDAVPPAVFDYLQAGDILFVDASHLFMRGTDLELLFLSIIPALKEGVYIHFHDIFLPFDYPESEDWRWWSFNEQTYLATLLLGGRYTPVMPAAYIEACHKELVKDIFAPKHPRGHISSFWLVKGNANNI